MTITNEERKEWRAHTQIVAGLKNVPGDAGLHAGLHIRISRLLDALDVAEATIAREAECAKAWKRLAIDEYNRAGTAEARADKIAKDFLYHVTCLINQAEIEKWAAEPSAEEERLCLLDIAIRRGERAEKAEKKLAWVIAEVAPKLLDCPPGPCEYVNNISPENCVRCWNEAAEKAVKK